MGLKQRLSLAVAVLHEPKLLILDEPTSGVDPVARDSFWELLAELSRKDGVTIFVTTHFMNEGMRCDRISLMHAGRVLAGDAPQKLIEQRGAKSLEDAFIALHGGRDRRRAAAPAGTDDRRRRRGAEAPPHRAEVRPIPLPLRPDARVLAQRGDPDPARSGAPGVRVRRLGAAHAGLRLRHHDRRRAHPLRRVRPRSVARESRVPRAVQRRAASTSRTPPVHSDEEALERLQSDDVSVIVEIPPSFGRDARRGAAPGGPRAGRRRDAVPRRDRRAVRARRAQHAARRSRRPGSPPGPKKYSASFQERYMYNPTFESIYSIVPSVPALLLILIPAILMTVSIVREKELGSIINFYVTPTGRLEYLLGKQLPYVAIGMINFFILAALALVVFGVSIKGSFLVLTLCTLLYLIVTTGVGMVTSTFTKTPGRGRVHHRDPHHPADDPVRRAAAAGVDAGGQRARHRHDLADDLLHALERRRVHQGPRARPDVPRPRHPGVQHPDPAGRSARSA